MRNLLMLVTLALLVFGLLALSSNVGHAVEQLAKSGAFDPNGVQATEQLAKSGAFDPLGIRAGEKLDPVGA